MAAVDALSHLDGLNDLSKQVCIISILSLNKFSEKFLVLKFIY